MTELEFGVAPVSGNEIIDFEKRGNMVRFYLGHNGEQWGDDWDDAPYEYNAGPVSDKYISGYTDVVFPYEYLVLEPADGTDNSWYCKQDFIDRNVPCIVVGLDDCLWDEDFRRAAMMHEECNKVVRVYFGDTIDDVLRKMPCAIIMNKQ